MAAQLSMLEGSYDSPLQRELRRLSDRVEALELALQEERKKTRRQQETISQLRFQLCQQPLPF